MAHVFAFVFSLGLLSLLPLAVNYGKRRATAGTLAHAHHAWMIRTFWIYAGWVLAVLLLGMYGLRQRPFFVVGLFLLAFAGAWVWNGWRLARGFLALEAGRAPR